MSKQCHHSSLSSLFNRACKNAENRIWRTKISKLFRRSMPPDPLILYSYPDFNYKDLKRNPSAVFLLDFKVSGWTGGRGAREVGTAGSMFCIGHILGLLFQIFKFRGGFAFCWAFFINSTHHQHPTPQPPPPSSKWWNFSITSKSDKSITSLRFCFVTKQYVTTLILLTVVSAWVPAEVCFFGSDKLMEI